MLPPSATSAPGRRTRAERTFGRSTVVRRYWLARCEGFRLHRDDGRDGLVETVVVGELDGDAELLVVRVGRIFHRRIVVSADEIDAVAPFEDTLLVERRPATARARIGREGPSRSRLAAQETVRAVRGVGRAASTHGQRLARSTSVRTAETIRTWWARSAPVVARGIVRGRALALAGARLIAVVAVATAASARRHGPHVRSVARATAAALNVRMRTVASWKVRRSSEREARRRQSP